MKIQGLTKVDIRPKLRFTPYSWAKLIFFRDIGHTEVACYGLSNKDDLLLVEDLKFIKQKTYWASWVFDDEANSNYFNDMLDQHYIPHEFYRILIHTHPNNSPLPSIIDDNTFKEILGEQDWNLMFILAQNDNWYSRMRFKILEQDFFVSTKLEIDFSVPCKHFTPRLWKKEYDENVERAVLSYDYDEEDEDDMIEILDDRLKIIRDLKSGGLSIPIGVERCADIT